MVQPGSVTVDVKGTFLREVSGTLPTTVNVIRTVAGLALPFRCTIVSGTVANPIVSFGSCSYNDICKDFFQNFFGMTTEKCPPELADLGIDCKCPFNILVRTFDGSLIFNIPDLSTTIYNNILNGDLDVTTTINNSENQHVACIRLKFTFQKAA